MNLCVSASRPLGAGLFMLLFVALFGFVTISAHDAIWARLLTGAITALIGVFAARSLLDDTGRFGGAGRALAW